MQVIDRRQFIIMDHPYEREDFKNITLQNGSILSYHEELPIQILGSTVLIGLAFSSTGEKVDLCNALEERYHWAGRWILIHDDQLYLDPCGSLGVFYGFSGDRLICSSSLRLITSQISTKWISNYQIKYNDGLPYMDYYPIPYTPYEGIKKMFPTQYINLKNGNLEIENEQWYDQFSEYSTEILYVKLKEKLLCIFENIGKEYGENVWIPLTAGVDSRTCIAVAKMAGIKFGAYTALRTNIDHWDKKAPKIICEKLGIKHFYMNDIGKNDSEREKTYDLHCGGKVSVGTDRTQFIANNDVPNAKDSIVLWGTAWEFYGRNFWGTFKIGKNNSERFDAWNHYSNGAICRSNIHEASLREWFDYVENHSMHTMDWRQRMYYEQRIGSWLSSAYQAIDLFDSDRISPVNCYDVFGILVNLVDRTFPSESRSDKRFQVRLINDFTPEISNIPYEKEKPFLHRAKRKIEKIFNL